MLTRLQPPDWAPPHGYANGIAARGTLLFVGGQIGWNAQQHFESDAFVAQARQALQNVVSVLAQAGARHLSFGPPLGPDPLAAVRLLGREVLPYFKSGR